MNKSKVISICTIVILVIVVAMAGCSGGGSDTGTGNTDSKDAATTGSAESVAPETTEDASSDTGDGGEDWAALAAAAVVATPQEWSGPTESIGEAPSGIKIAGMPSDGQLSGCADPVKGALNAGEALGWETQFYDGGGNPAQQNKMILSAIAWGANVIFCGAVDPKGIQQGLKAAKDAGVMMISGSDGIDDPNPPLELAEGELNFEFDVSPDYKALGNAVAAWIVNDASNQGEIVVYVDTQFPSNLALQVGLLEGLDKSNMTRSEPQIMSGSQIGDNLNRQVTSYLTAHPNCKYVFMPYDPAAASVVEGLNQAGMTDIKVIGTVGSEQNLGFIRDGNLQVADASYDNEYMGWAAVDQALRLMNDKPLFTPHNENMPYIVIDKDNVPPAGSSFQVAKDQYDYRAEYLKLWGKS